MIDGSIIATLAANTTASVGSGAVITGVTLKTDTNGKLVPVSAALPSQSLDVVIDHTNHYLANVASLGSMSTNAKRNTLVVQLLKLFGLTLNQGDVYHRSGDSKGVNHKTLTQAVVTTAGTYTSRATDTASPGDVIALRSTDSTPSKVSASSLRALLEDLGYTDTTEAKTATGRRHNMILGSQVVAFDSAKGGGKVSNLSFWLKG